MSLERNNEIGLPATYVEIPGRRQLVPYYPGQNQIVANTPKPGRLLPSYNNSFSGRDPLPSQHLSTQTDNQADCPKAAYDSDLRLIRPKINQVGLLIDIYA